MIQWCEFRSITIPSWRCSRQAVHGNDLCSMHQGVLDAQVRLLLRDLELQ